MDVKEILKDFNKLAEARKKYTTQTKIAFIFSAAVISMVLFFSYRAVDNAMDKILVVNEGGELLHFKAVENDQLYESLLNYHCASTAYYVNSFDRLNLHENQKKALYLVNKPDANTIFAKYQTDRAYGDAVELGVVYQTEYKGIDDIKVRGAEYDVTFKSVLTIVSSTGKKKFVILSKGTAIRTTPSYPKNTTGFFFKNYTQDYLNYVE